MVPFVFQYFTKKKLFFFFLILALLGVKGLRTCDFNIRKLAFFLHRGKYFKYNVGINSQISLDNFKVTNNN